MIDLWPTNKRGFEILGTKKSGVVLYALICPSAVGTAIYRATYLYLDTKKDSFINMEVKSPCETLAIHNRLTRGFDIKIIHEMNEDDVTAVLVRWREIDSLGMH